MYAYIFSFVKFIFCTYFCDINNIGIFILSQNKVTFILKSKITHKKYKGKLHLILQIINDLLVDINFESRSKIFWKVSLLESLSLH